MHDKDKNVSTPAERFHLALDMVQDVLGNPDCINYSRGRGPLTLDQLSEEAALRVVTVADKVGWPTKEDASISSTLNYTDESFLDNFFEQPSNIPYTDDVMTDEEIDALERNTAALNNFVLNLRATPIDNFQESASMMEGFYGLTPVVHRANALAPELFTALREATNCFTLAEQDFAKSILSREENQDMVTALHMGYRIMGRLLKQGDLSVGIRDAHATLTA